MSEPTPFDVAQLQALAVTSGEARERITAIRRLSVLDGPGHMATFRAVLDEDALPESVEAAAVRALGLAGPEAERDLVARLASPAPRRTRRAVLAGLAQRGGAEALAALAALAPEPIPALARRIDFTRRLIAHRLREPGEIPPIEAEFTAIPTSDPLPMSVDTPDADETARALRHLASQDFGVAGDAETLRRITLGGVPHLILFDRGLTRAEFRESLGTRPALIGLIAEQSEVAGLPSIADGIILTTVAPDPRLTIWCRNGEPLLAGAMRVTDDHRIEARIDQHAPPGGVALEVTLTAGPDGIVLSSPRAERVLGRRRSPTPLRSEITP